MATEKRLIDANETINVFTNWLTSRYDGRLPRDVVAEIPTVDAVEVVHGRWNRRKSCHSQTGFVDQCSVCQFALVHLGHKTNYCPNCGAKMDMEGESNGRK